MANVETKHTICKHIKSGEYARHSTIRWVTEPEGKNTTDYHWDITVEMCPLCSGAGYARIQDALQEISHLLGGA